MKAAGLSMIIMVAVFVWLQPTSMNLVLVAFAVAGLMFLALGSLPRERR
jgi:hypothetical protein